MTRESQVEGMRERIALPAVFVGVISVGAAAIFIRVADAPALGIAFWRCTLGVIALSRSQPSSGKACRRGAISGPVPWRE